MKSATKILIAASLLAISSTIATAQYPQSPPTPPAQKFDWSTEPARGAKAMVVSDEKLASGVGAEIMKRGGNAIDAAVAVGFALAVVDPEAGNIGGGGFMLVRLANGRTSFIDYREVAPAKASREMYMKSDGTVDPQASLRLSLRRRSWHCRRTHPRPQNLRHDEARRRDGTGHPSRGKWFPRQREPLRPVALDGICVQPIPHEPPHFSESRHLLPTRRYSSPARTRRHSEAHRGKGSAGVLWRTYRSGASRRNAARRRPDHPRRPRELQARNS